MMFGSKFLYLFCFFTNLSQIVFCKNIEGVELFTSDRVLRVIISNNIINGRNLLLQTSINRANVIYEIVEEFDLDGDTIFLGDNVSLDFNGGSIVNGHVVFNNTRISGTYNGILCECSGSIIGEVLIDYFGVSPVNSSSQNSRNINNIKISPFCYKFGAGTYRFDSPIEIKKDCEYAGESRRITTLKFERTDGFIVNKNINTLADYVSSRADFKNMKIDSYGNCFDLFSCRLKDDSLISRGLSYSTFENLLLVSRNANGFYSTTPSRTTYANVFRNILFTVPNGACFNNLNLYLCSRIDNCADLGSKYFFYNCFLRQVSIVNCNLGFGNRSNHIYYNDKKGIICDQTAWFAFCNFEEQNSNLFVNLDETTVCYFKFLNCNFNMGNLHSNLNGKSVFLAVGDKRWKVTKVQYNEKEHAGKFAPCVGYGLYFNFDETCDFSWFNEYDNKRFPFIVNTYINSNKIIKKIHSPNTQCYRVFIKGEGVKFINGSENASVFNIK